jgi:hypothetical protein
MVEYLISKKGYFYKIIKNKKKRISQKEYQNKNKIMKGGNLTETEIFDNYYLCTASRYDKPIIDHLLPMGSFTELEKLYRNNKDLNNIKNKQIKINNAKIVGSSQYGLYFRLVKKEDIEKYEILNSNEINFKSRRSFIFDFNKFLDYVSLYTESIPLFFFTNSNGYGYEYVSSCKLYKTNKIDFVKCIGNLLEKSLYDHELVCRIPIPLNKKTGFIGKINFSILNLINKEQYYKNRKEQYYKNRKEQYYKNMDDEYENLDEEYHKCKEMEYKIIRRNRKSFENNRKKCKDCNLKFHGLSKGVFECRPYNS